MPSAALHVGTAVEGSFQGAGGMVPSARLLTANGGAAAPSRREETTTANGGGPGSGSGSSDLAALRPTNRPRGKAQAGGKPRKRAPIWNLQAAVFVSVVLNVGLLLQHYVNSTAPSHHHHHHHQQQQEEHLQACPMHLDDAGVSRSRRGRQEEPSSVPNAGGAPSTGKPAVTPDSVINLDHGDPAMFEEFWRGTGAAAEIVIPGWQTMSYFSDVGNVCWFLEPGLDHEVRRLHRLVGNAAVDGYHVLVGTGSTQLFMAALYALSPPAGAAAAPMSVVSTAPYYSEGSSTNKSSAMDEVYRCCGTRPVKL